MDEHSIAARYGLQKLRDEVLEYFSAIEQHLAEQSDVWDQLTPEYQQHADDLRARVRSVMAEVAKVAQDSLLLSETDLRELGSSAKRMAAAIRFRRFQEFGITVHHDEDIVLGVTPAHQSDDERISLQQARTIFTERYRRTNEVIDLLAVRRPRLEAFTTNPQTTSYRPNTAFIMMWINPDQPELDDVRDTVREVFQEFGIIAVRADEIEHEEGITDKIMDEIKTSEFLFADLTGERPSVYYEIGYAHALNRRVMLYRKKGAKIHFDIAHRNVPDYENLGDLRTKLRKRLVQHTNKTGPV
jgi:hypothetical protein